MLLSVLMPLSCHQLALVTVLLSAGVRRDDTSVLTSAGIPDGGRRDPSVPPSPALLDEDVVNRRDGSPCHSLS